METRGESSESDLRERRVHMCMEEIERRVREHGPWTMRTTHCMLTRVWPVLPHIEHNFLRSFTVKLRYSQHVCVCLLSSLLRAACGAAFSESKEGTQDAPRLRGLVSTSKRYQHIGQSVCFGRRFSWLR